MSLVGSSCSSHSLGRGAEGTMGVSGLDAVICQSKNVQRHRKKVSPCETLFSFLSKKMIMGRVTSCYNVFQNWTNRIQYAPELTKVDLEKARTYGLKTATGNIVVCLQTCCWRKSATGTFPRTPPLLHDLLLFLGRTVRNICNRYSYYTYVWSNISVSNCIQRTLWNWSSEMPLIVRLAPTLWRASNLDATTARFAAYCRQQLQCSPVFYLLLDSAMASATSAVVLISSSHNAIQTLSTVEHQKHLYWNVKDPPACDQSSWRRLFELLERTVRCSSPPCESRTKAKLGKVDVEKSRIFPFFDFISPFIYSN